MLGLETYTSPAGLWCRRRARKRGIGAAFSSWPRAFSSGGVFECVVRPVCLIFLLCQALLPRTGVFGLSLQRSLNASLSGASEKKGPAQLKWNSHVASWPAALDSPVPGQPRVVVTVQVPTSVDRSAGAITMHNHPPKAPCMGKQKPRHLLKPYHTAKARSTCTCTRTCWSPNCESQLAVTARLGLPLAALWRALQGFNCHGTEPTGGATETCSRDSSC